MASSNSSGEIVFPRQRLFQFKRHSIGSTRWSVTSWILPILPYEKKQHWPLWQARRWAVYLKIWLQMFDTPFTNANHWAQGNSWSVTGIHRQLHRIFHRIWQSFDVIFCRICNLSAVWFSRANLDTILTSLRPAVNPLLGCSSGKPLSRQIGVRVCPAARFNFFSTAFDPRGWTMVVFWKENLGRQPHGWLHLRTKEGDETNYPTLPKFFGDPDVPFGPSGPPGPLGPPGLPGPPDLTTRMASSSDHLLVIEKEWHLESTSRERLPLRPSPPESQLIPIPMKWWRRWSATTRRETTWDGPDRMSEKNPHAQAATRTANSTFAWSRTLMMYQMRTSQIWIPHHHQLTCHHQLDREVAPEETRDPDRVSEHLHYPSSQDADEDSATVDLQNRVSDRSRSPQEQEGSRRQDPHQQKGKKTVAEERPGDLPSAKKHKPIWFRWRRWRTSKRAWNFFKLSTNCTSTS